jgi:hypothetical protein
MHSREKLVCDEEHHALECVDESLHGQWFFVAHSIFVPPLLRNPLDTGIL